MWRGGRQGLVFTRQKFDMMIVIKKVLNGEKSMIHKYHANVIRSRNITRSIFTNKKKEEQRENERKTVQLPHSYRHSYPTPPTS